MRWSLGVPMVSGRVLSTTELERVKNVSGRVSRKMWLKAAGLPVFVLAVLACMLFFGLTKGEAGKMVFWLLAIGGLCFSWPIALLSARDDFRLRRSLGRDISSGKVYRFEGVIRREEVLEYRTFQRMTEQLALLDISAPQWFELLPDSGLMLQTHMGEPRGLFTLPHVELAASGADQYSVPVRDKFPGADPKLLCRHMTQAESSEILRRIPEFRTANMGAMIFFVIWSLMGLVSWYLHGRTFPLPYLLLLAFVLFRTGHMLSSFVGQWRLCSRFRQDVKEGFIFIDPSVEMEFLPVSMLIWAQRRKPAPWRLFS